MTWFQRVGMAMQAAWTTGLTEMMAVYKRGYIAPLDTPIITTHLSWDSYSARLFRYHYFDLYYFNETFTELEKFRTQHQRQFGLYKYIRPIYNPVFRLVNITASKCYGGALDWENLKRGPIVLDSADKSVIQATLQMARWSNLGALKMLYPRTAARYGDVFLKLVDDPQKQKVRLEVLHPGCVREMTVDAVGHVKQIVIEYLREDPKGDQSLAGQDSLGMPPMCVYREVIDHDRFATYRIKNNEVEPYGWQTDENGYPISEWPNPYGFVPVVHVKASDIGRTWGAVTFHGGQLTKLDELNDVAAYAHDQIRRSVDMLVYFAGVNKLRVEDATVPKVSDEDAYDSHEREELRTLTGPVDSQPYVLAGNLDFSGPFGAMDRLIDELERDLPELSFARLREYQLHSNPAIRTALVDAVERLEDFNGNLDAGLMRAFQMGISIGGYNNYPGFERFDLDDYAAGNLDFRIKPRDIVSDTVTMKERLDLFIQTDAPNRWTWEELGKAKEDIVAAETEQLSRERAVAGEVARAFSAVKDPTPSSDNGNGRIPQD